MIDRRGLHWLLWHRRMSNNTIHVIQKDWAEELLVSKFSFSRVMRRMEEEGRVRDLTGTGATSKTYEIYDPTGFDKDDDG